MYFTVTKDGRRLRKRRYWFSETFYIIANAEYAKATGLETLFGALYLLGRNDRLNELFDIIITEE